MTEHAPIVDGEARFLHCDADLVSVSRRQTSLGASHASPFDGTPASRLILSVITAAALLPILSFGLVPGLLPRLVIVLIIAGASVSVLAQSRPTWPMLEGRLELGLAVYVGTMSVMACVMA